MQPDFSVIITNYNTASYIKRAVDSALSQEGVTVEVIVVDDVSQDNSWAVIQDLSDPRIKKYLMPSNGGPGGARNLALAQATGKWIAILDSDDTLAPGRLARLHKLLQENNADIAADDLLVCREEDGKQFPMFGPERLTQLKNLSLAAFITGNQAFLGGYTLGYLKPVFSREFLDRHQLRYDPEIRIGEDYFLLAGALALGAQSIIDPKAGYNYTARKGSISHRLTAAHVERIQACDAKLMQRYKLDAAAKTAQVKRTRKLRQAFAFSELVHSLKSRDLKGCLKAIRTDVTCLLPLWRPFAVRLQRVIRRLARP